MYQVYGTVGSRAFRVLWALEEVGAAYELKAAKPQSPEVLAVNPSGKIPAMIVDGTPLTDSTAIMTYIADKHGALTYPAGTLERARQDALTHAILDELDAVLWTAARHSFILPEEERVAEIKPALKIEYARNIERIAEGIEGPFAIGDMMTIPDILLTHCCNWAISAKFPAAPDSLKSYLSSMRARPAFEAVRALA